jgi:hypothetical protein
MHLPPVVLASGELAGASDHGAAVFGEVYGGQDAAVRDMIDSDRQAVAACMASALVKHSGGGLGQRTELRRGQRLGAHARIDAEGPDLPRLADTSSTHCAGFCAVAQRLP